MKRGTDTGYFWSEKFLDDPDSVGEDFWDSLGKKIPLGRAGLPEDVGRAVAITHTIYKTIRLCSIADSGMCFSLAVREISS